jgi:tetratricopeptide (TPR) repeat protein
MNARYEEALAHYQALLDDGVADPEVLLGAGQTALALGREEAGLRWLERASLDPVTRPDAFRALTSYLGARGRWTQALATLDRAVREAPGQADLHRLRAQARYHAGDPAGAASDLETVLSLVPGDSAARERLAALREEIAR